MTRVVALSYKGDMPKIGLTMRQPGLGKIDWIKEEKKKAKAGVEKIEKEEKKVEKEKPAKKEKKVEKKEEKFVKKEKEKEKK